jgi:hypothetical protein
MALLSGRTISSQTKWNRSNLHKLAAHAAVRVALRQGRLKRGRCEVSGSLRVDAHHDDYRQPLKVRWLARKWHQRLHVLLKAGSTTEGAIALLREQHRAENAASPGEQRMNSLNWPQDRLDRYWALQKRARKAGLRLTADKLGGGRQKHIMLRLRGPGERNDLLVDLTEAEAAIATLEVAATR